MEIFKSSDAMFIESAVFKD